MRAVSRRASEAGADGCFVDGDGEDAAGGTPRRRAVHSGAVYRGAVYRAGNVEGGRWTVSRPRPGHNASGSAVRANGGRAPLPRPLQADARRVPRHRAHAEASFDQARGAGPADRGQASPEGLVEEGLTAVVERQIQVLPDRAGAG